MQGRRLDAGQAVQLFWGPLFAHMGEFAIQVRLGCRTGQKVRCLAGGRLDAWQAVRCRTGGPTIVWATVCSYGGVCYEG